MPPRDTIADVLANRAPWAVAFGDCGTSLSAVPDDSVHCCVTSPPYYGLRAYLPEDHPDKALEIGSEESPEEYVERMVGAFRHVRRVLHPSGTLWLNLGDTFANDVKGPNGQPGPALDGSPNTEMPPKNWRGCGLKKKDIIGAPWMVAFALRADGWYLRQWCPWVKRNPMPDSTEDRPGTACETVFVLAKRSDYFFDMEAVKRSVSPSSAARLQQDIDHQDGSPRANGGSRKNRKMKAVGNDETRNFRSSDLWFDSVGMLLAEDSEQILGLDVTLKSYKGAHFAVMPKKLVEPCILAATSAKGVCPHCGEPWVRLVEKDRKPTRPGRDTKVTAKMVGDTATATSKSYNRSNHIGNRDPKRHITVTQTVGWRPGCTCPAAEPVPAVVLDPFVGSGTVLSVALEHGRRAVGCELNEANWPLIEARLRSSQTSLFGEELL